MRRVLFWLREVVWTSVISVVMLLAAAALSILGMNDLALVSAAGSITFAILATRS